jgi:TadE-like protein
MRPLPRGLPERGATLVETALVLVFLSIMFLGITEYGFAWRQATVVEKSAQLGGRAAGNGANGRFADYETLRSVQSAFGSASNVTINTVIVFKSSSSDGAMDPDCLTASKSGVCNRYVASDLTRPASQFGCGGSSPDVSWCPMSRVRDRAPSSDYVGVYIDATYDGLTGILPGGGMNITRSAIYALEPCAFGLPDC